MILLRVFVRVLKTFAVHYGLRLSFGQYPYAGTKPLVRRKALCTFAKSFLMHAHKSLSKILKDYIRSGNIGLAGGLGVFAVREHKKIPKTGPAKLLRRIAS